MIWMLVRWGRGDGSLIKKRLAAKLTSKPALLGPIRRMEE
jgi:hypothetical protein